MGSNPVQGKRKKREVVILKKMASVWSKEAVCCNRFDVEEMCSNFIIILLHGLGHHCLINITRIIMHALHI